MCITARGGEGEEIKRRRNEKDKQNKGEEKYLLTHLLEDRLRQFFAIDDLHRHSLAREAVNSQFNET